MSASQKDSPGARWGDVKSWGIVLAGDATPAERYAAEELRELLGRASGHRIPLAGEVDGPNHIFVGPGAVRGAGGISFDAYGMGPEEHRVLVTGTGIAIAGGRPRGTLYGVYAFLERALGVRFLTSEHTHLPAIDDGTLIPAMDETYDPPFGFRWSAFGEISDDHAFATRMRTNTVQTEEHLGGKTPIGLVNHTFHVFMPWKKYGEDHPEYYNETDGERPSEVYDDHFDPGVQLCTTNPDVARIMCEEVLKSLEREPGQGNVSVSQNDNSNMCQCESCRTVDEREGSHMGSHLNLVNSVAEAVSERFPGVLVGTLAYSYTRKPPASIRPRPNVQIQLCSIECCQTHAIDDPACPRNRSFCEDIEGWGRISDYVSVWTYVTNFHFYQLPCPNLRALGRNIRFFRKNGVRGLFMQGPQPVAELADLRNYLISNLIWNPDREDGELIDEFLRLHYGSGAGYVKEYIDLVHDAAERGTTHRNCFGTAADHGLDADLGRAGLEIFERAMAEAESAEIKSRLEKASIGCHALVVEPVVYSAHQKVRTRKRNRDREPLELDEQVARDTRPHLQEFFDLCRKHGVVKVGEWGTWQEVEAVLREWYGMGGGEKF